MSEVIRVCGLHKSFRSGLWASKTPVLRNVEFAIPAGKITGFLGANGSGKTTTLKCILDLIQKDSGQIFYFGQNSFSSEVRRQIGFLPERPFFYEHLTGFEFLFLMGRLSGVQEEQKKLQAHVEQLLAKMGLESAARKPLRAYSKGMLQRVGIAQALIHRPRLLILDEPMSGLDPDGRYEVKNLILEAAAQGTSVFFSSHQIPDVESLCQHLVILKNGEVLYQGPMDGLRQKFQKEFLILYRDPQQKNQTASRSCKDLSDLQSGIDELRRQRAEIFEIQAQKYSLESAYAQLTRASSVEVKP